MALLICQQRSKSKKIQKGLGEELPAVLVGRSVKREKDKISKVEGEEKERRDRGDQDFLEKLQGETNLGGHCEYFK